MTARKELASVEASVAEIIRLGPQAVASAIAMLRLGPGGLCDYADHLQEKVRVQLGKPLEVSLGGGGRSPVYLLQVARPTTLLVPGKDRVLYQKSSTSLQELSAGLDAWLIRVRGAKN